MKEKKSLRFRIIRLFILLILLLPLWSFLIWAFRPVRPLNVFILDKTVLTSKGSEHRSLNSILIHQKYSKPDRKLYRIAKDYWGFFPEKKGGNYRIRDLDSIVYARLDTIKSGDGILPVYNRQSKSNLTYEGIDSLAERLDALYYTDLYGINQAEWFSGSLRIPNVSPVIYGGLTDKEFHLLKRMKTLNKLVIIEFNLYHDPTPREVRDSLLQAVNIRPTGWVGTYIQSLDPLLNRDIPLWIIRNYMKNHPGKWPFSKPGIVFVREDGWVEILEDDTHLEVQIPFIYTDQPYRKQYGVADKVPYPFWFEINEPLNDSAVIVSRFRIEPTVLGDSILRQHGIPAEFPAVLKSRGSSHCYFYCADFCDNPVSLLPSYFAGSGWFSKSFYEKDYSQRSEFFYEYYRPLMNSILDEYYRSMR